jgi:transcriptional antiterminator NusG
MPDDVLSPETTPMATAAEPHPAPAEPAVPAPPGAEPALEADALPLAEPEVKSPDPDAAPKPKAARKPRTPSARTKKAATPAKPEVVEVEQPNAAELTESEAAPAPPAAESNKRWYAVKVQSGREETIKDAIERRVKIEGLEEYYGQILIPVERVQEIKNGKRVVKERKKFPGYLMAEVEYNDRILYLFRETSGVGDFVGGSINRPPPPLPSREIERMLGGVPGKDEKSVPDVAPFEKGDRVSVKDGIFAGMEGEVKDVLEAKGQVRVELTIFGRPTSVELEYWQIEQL